MVTYSELKEYTDQTAADILISILFAEIGDHELALKVVLTSHANTQKMLNRVLLEGREDGPEWDGLLKKIRAMDLSLNYPGA
jgi:hypothetical protein